MLRRPFRYSEDDSSSTDEPLRIKQLVDWELVLTADYVRSTLFDLADESWKSSLPYLLEDFQQLLRDALDLLRSWESPTIVTTARIGICRPSLCTGRTGGSAIG